MKLMEIYRLDENAYDDAIVSFQKKSPDTDSAEIEKIVLLFREKLPVIKNADLPSYKKNIQWWSSKNSDATYDAFKNMVTSVAKPTAKAIERGKVGEGDYITLFNNDKWHILVPMDHTAGIHFGRGTAWCVSKPNQTDFSEKVFDLKDTLVFCINKHNVTKNCVVLYSSEHEIVETPNYDQKKFLSDVDFEKLGLPTPVELMRMALKHSSTIEEKREENAKTDLRMRIINANSRDKELENDITRYNGVNFALLYMKKFNDSRIAIKTKNINTIVHDALSMLHSDKDGTYLEKIVSDIFTYFPNTHNDPQYLFNDAKNVSMAVEKTNNKNLLKYTSVKYDPFTHLRNGDLSEFEYLTPEQMNTEDAKNAYKEGLIKNINDGNYGEYEYAREFAKNDKSVKTVLRDTIKSLLQQNKNIRWDVLPPEMAYDPEFKGQK